MTRPEEEGAEIALAAARTFRGADGRKLLAYLRRLTVERVVRADAGEGELRDLEGQRRIVKRIENLIERGNRHDET